MAYQPNTDVVSAYRQKRRQQLMLPQATEPTQPDAVPAPAPIPMPPPVDLSSRRERRDYLRGGTTPEDRATRIAKVTEENTLRRREFIARHPVLTRFSPDAQAQRQEAQGLTQTYAQMGLQRPEGGFGGRSLQDPGTYSSVAQVYRDRYNQAQADLRAQHRMAAAKAAHLPLHLYDPNRVQKFLTAPDFNVEYLGKPVMKSEMQFQPAGPNGEFGTVAYDPETGRKTLVPPRQLKIPAPGEEGFERKDSQGRIWHPKQGGGWELDEAEKAKIKQVKVDEAHQQKVDVATEKGWNAYGKAQRVYHSKAQRDLAAAEHARDAAAAVVKSYQQQIANNKELAGDEAGEITEPPKMKAALEKAQADHTAAVEKILRISRREGEYAPPDYRVYVPEEGLADVQRYRQDTRPPVEGPQVDTGGEFSPDEDPDANAPWANQPALESLPLNYEMQGPDLSEMDYVNQVVKLISDYYEPSSIHDALEREFQAKHGMTPQEAEEKADDIFVKAGLGDAGGQ